MTKMLHMNSPNTTSSQVENNIPFLILKVTNKGTEKLRKEYMIWEDLPPYNHGFGVGVSTVGRSLTK